MRLFRNCQFFLRTFSIFFAVFTLFTNLSSVNAGPKKRHHHGRKAKESAGEPIRTNKALSLTEQIDDILQSTHLAKSSFSIQVISLSDGHSIYEKNAELPLNPASNMKVVTEAAALQSLGGDFTFKTEFYTDAHPTTDGQVGKLWIKGGGDPWLVTEEVESIADEFAAAGIREITGPVFVDDSFFDHSNTTTYLSDRGDRLYNILTGSLSFNFNSKLVGSRQGLRMGDQAELIPPSHKRSFSKHSVRSVRASSDPGIYAASNILQTFESKGIKIDPSAIVATRDTVPQGAVPLFTHKSPPLREILKGMGKFSNNFIAEQVLKTMGAVRYGVPGSTSKGVMVQKEYLTSLGIPGGIQGNFVLDNGSGLSRVSRISSAQLVQVLSDQYNNPHREEFIDSLSVFGVDGTLRAKSKSSPLREKVFAKTGTLNDVKSLSGYLFDGRQKVAFAFIFNDFQMSPRRVVQVEEAILKTVMERL